MFLLDTNTLIYFFKGLGKVKDNLLSVPPKDVAIPAIVYFELQVGIQKSSSPKKRTGQLSDVIQIITVLSFGAEEAVHAAKVRAELEKRGQPIGAYDLLIAGTALADGNTLVTHNVKEFSKIKELKVVDWY